MGLNIRNNSHVIPCENGKIYRFFPNFNKPGCVLSIVNHAFFNIRIDKSWYLFADDSEFSLYSNGLTGQVNVADFDVYYNSIFLSYVLTEELEIKILRFNRTLNKIICDYYNYDNRDDNIKRVAGLKIIIKSGNVFPVFDESHFVEVLSSDINDNVLENLTVTISDVITDNSWFHSNKRDIIMDLLIKRSSNRNLISFLTQTRRNCLITDLLI